MNLKNTPQTYGALSIGMHWLMFILIVATYASIELRELFDKGSEIRNDFKIWHFTLGLSVLVLLALRLSLVVLQKTPSISPAPSALQQRLAKLAHRLLYAFMIIMPVLGWLILSGEGKTIPFYGWELPALISESEFWADIFEEMHEFIGVMGYWLIGLHAFAALFHHYLLRDNTLVRMLPFKKD
ncbi:cytochrome b561 [Thiomicrorhabdus immobilis]|uniref:Cytochrome b561 n=1 Tax=Thiomicrorhabdus immobilis TaxID=2791037 RepID=A0ABN6D1X0_9GAMM|nr:cytochrome b [Thiomicrorhabdus immobilis]BCN94187.1 cytochrome b561 [Thiomicrorhabdus immobilis]